MLWAEATSPAGRLSWLLDMEVDDDVALAVEMLEHFKPFHMDMQRRQTDLLVKIANKIGSLAR